MKPQYRHRRLRQPKTPRWALITPNHITAEQAEQVKAAWATACRQPIRPVVLAGGFTIKRLR
jgi:hypothetical protein